MGDKAETKRDYQAPALDKGLEILEFLSDKDDPFGMVEIAAALQRSRNEIYRMLIVLERRGYLIRTIDDRFLLSNRLFQLSMRSPPMRNLHDVAMPVMHQLAETLHQSCHLAVLSGNEIVVIARVESPHLLGFAVRVGYRVPIMLSTSGRVLLAHKPAPQRAQWAERMLAEGAEPDALRTFLADCERTAERGHLSSPSVFVDAITDLGAPVFDAASDGPVASLVVPYVSGSSAYSTLDEALQHLLAAADEISDGLRHG